MGLLDRLKKLLGTAETPLLRPVDLEAVQSLLGYTFRDTELAALALTHRSFTRGDSEEAPANERLEFLGDSVVGLVIASQLYQDFPTVREGELTQAKARMVNETTLAGVTVDTGLAELILLSPEEERQGGRERPSILADVYESVIAAVYLDGGFRAARDIVLRTLYTRRDDILNDDTHRNFKGELLELMQGKGAGLPRYEVVSEGGPDHQKTFDVRVSVGGRVLGSGTGYSKKEAEQKAAAEALQVLGQVSGK
jgi:ribonuclease-3